MKQLLRIPTKLKVPNPRYSPEAARLSKENKQEYLEKKEVEEIRYTSVAIEGFPEIVKKISEFVFDNFKEVA